MLDRVEADLFRPGLNEPFVLEAGNGERLTLSLVEIRPLGHRRSDADRDPFALLFRGPPDPVLPQAIYPLAHAAVGRLEVFLVPVARTAAGTDYEAIFT